MTSLIFGIICLYLSVTILRMPEQQFYTELNQITGREHSQGYYTFMRVLIWAIGFTGAAMILLRFF